MAVIINIFFFKERDGKRRKKSERSGKICSWKEQEKKRKALD